MQGKPKTIVIADDHPIFRIGIASLLSTLPSYTLVSEANNGIEAIDALTFHKPNFIVLDLDMPVLSGFEVVKYIFKECLSVKVIVLTAHTDPVTLKKIIDYKTVSILFKESATLELPQCLAKMDHGEVFISPLCKKFCDAAAKENKKNLEVLEMLNRLTATESKILSLISQHFTTNQIAEKLNNSHKTIENHRSNIALKLGLSGPNSILNFAADNLEFIKKGFGIKNGEDSIT